VGTLCNNPEELTDPWLSTIRRPSINDDSTGFCGPHRGFYRLFHKFTASSQTTDYLNLYMSYRRLKEIFMFFEIERDSFLEGLSKAVPITEKRSTLPILSHLLIAATDPENLIITATDLEVGLQMSYNYIIKEPGSLTVPARKIYEIVRELAPGQISVQTTESKRIKIVSGESEFELACMDASDYPVWITFEEIETFSMPAEKLLYMIDKTLFASSSDDSRFNLNGVLFEQDAENTRLVATDGHRLALIAEDVKVSLKSSVLVPKKGLLELRRLLENLKGDVSVGFEEKNMFVRTDRFMMTVRLIEGDYPDYRKVIPEAGEKMIKANRQKVLQALKRVAILTSDRNKGVNVQVNPGKMEFTATHPDLGTARDVVEVEYQGEEFGMIINVGYLIESLNVVDTDTISFEFHREGAPLVIRPEPVKGYFNLVMPMRK
jgi:DNA polymerase III subunit beta